MEEGLPLFDVFIGKRVAELEALDSEELEDPSVDIEVVEEHEHYEGSREQSGELRNEWNYVNRPHDIEKGSVLDVEDLNEVVANRRSHSGESPKELK